jgi:TolB-like protein/cytochrome c-type biogenesis protein CcmH/NrfG
MQLVQGDTLDRVIPERGLPVERLLEIGVGVADGLRAAHERGVIHRDIKPANLMLDAEGRVKILDFGLAKLRATDGGSDPARLPTAMSRQGQLLGTIPYMSPEQVQGDTIDHRSDLFSFGVVLYEMIAGRPPFRGGSPAAIAGALMRDAPAPVTELRRDLPGELVRLLNRCLEKEREARVQTAAEVRDILRDVQSRPLRGRLTGMRSGASRWGRRAIPGALAAAALVATLVTLWGTLTPQPAPERAAGGTGWKASVAVLPFVNLSGDAGQEYFCDGLTEELIAKLSRIQELKVVARTSAFAFKGQGVDVREVGRRLGVGHVLEGSVRKSGSRLRVSTQLVSVDDGYQLWSETYDRDLDDILAVQDGIARAVASTLQLTLLGEEEPILAAASTEAYNAFLMGRFLYGQQDRESLERAAGYFEEATRLDPGLARAWAGLGAALAYQAATGYVDPEVGFEEAKTAVGRALAVDPDLAHAHRVLGWIQMTYDWDWTAAEASYQRATALEPARGHVERAQLAVAQGRFDVARDLARRAVELDPVSTQPYSTLGLACWYGGREEEALAAYGKILELNPGSQTARGLMAAVYLTQSRPEEARALLSLVTDSFWRLPGMAMALHALGRRAESDEALSELIAEFHAGGAYNVAQVHAYRGEADPAFEWLERARAQHDGGMFLVRVDPLLEGLRDDPRFEALLTRMCLPPG